MSLVTNRSPCKYSRIQQYRLRAEGQKVSNMPNISTLLRLEKIHNDSWKFEHTFSKVRRVMLSSLALKELENPTKSATHSKKIEEDPFLSLLSSQHTFMYLYTRNAFHCSHLNCALNPIWTQTFLAVRIKSSISMK